MMVELGRLALTTTPSIFPSCVDDTVPVSAAGTRFCAVAGCVAAAKASRLTRAIAPNENFASSFPTRVAVVMGSPEAAQRFIRSCRQARHAPNAKHTITPDCRDG